MLAKFPEALENPARPPEMPFENGPAFREIPPRKFEKNPKNVPRKCLTTRFINVPKSKPQIVDYKELMAFCTVVDGCAVYEGAGVVRQELRSEGQRAKGKERRETPGREG